MLYFIAIRNFLEEYDKFKTPLTSKIVNSISKIRPIENDGINNNIRINSTAKAFALLVALLHLNNLFDVKDSQGVSSVDESYLSDPDLSNIPFQY